MAMASDVFNLWKLDLKVEKPRDDMGSHTLSIFFPKTQPDYMKKEHLSMKNKAATHAIWEWFMIKIFKLTT